MNFKLAAVWALCVGSLCLGCLCLYGSLEENMREMSDLFADMGVFSEALGMDKVGLGTLEGYYAVEISILFSLGGAMFAAMLGAGLVAKEEEGHTVEFLNVLPLGRSRILAGKYGAMAALILVFHLVCICLVLGGFAWMGEMPDWGCFARYHGAAFLLCLETGTLCFLLSVLCRKKPTGAAVGLAVLFYMLDLMCRVVPALEKMKYLTPFYYANAADIFSGGEIERTCPWIGLTVTVMAFGAAFFLYGQKDLA